MPKIRIFNLYYKCIIMSEIIQLKNKETQEKAYPKSIADAVYDENLGKYQSEINSELADKVVNDWQEDLLNTLYGGVITSVSDAEVTNSNVSLPYTSNEYGTPTTKYVNIPRATRNTAGIITGMEYQDMMNVLQSYETSINPTLASLRGNGWIDDITFTSQADSLSLGWEVQYGDNTSLNDTNVPVVSTTKAGILTATQYTPLKELVDGFENHTALDSQFHTGTTGNTYDSNAYTSNTTYASLVKRSDNLWTVNISHRVYGGARLPVVNACNLVQEKGLYYVKDLIEDNINAKHEEVTTNIQSCETAIEDLDNSKADINDLSNVIGEEVIDNPLLEEINTLTVDEVQNGALRKLYINAGATYNETTKTYTLNGVTGITEAEMLDIYKYSHLIFVGSQALRNLEGVTLKTNFLFSRRPINVYISTYASAIDVFTIARNENLDNSCVTVSTGQYLPNCKKIIGVLQFNSTPSESMFSNCPNLTTLKLYLPYNTTTEQIIHLEYCPLLDHDSLAFIATNTAKGSGTKVIHLAPTAFALLTESDIAAAAAKNVIFVEVS